MTSTNDGKDVKSNQTSGPKGKTYFIELYKSLENQLNAEAPFTESVAHLCSAWRHVHTLCLHSAPSTHPHLISWIQRHTARTVLQSEWQKEIKDEQPRLEGAIDEFTQECQNAASARDGAVLPWENQLLGRAAWFKSILANLWGHPVLKALSNLSGERPSTEEVLEWLREERGIMFAARVRQLALSKRTEDIALTLVTAVMDLVRATREVVSDLDLVEEDKAAPPKPSSGEPTFESILSAEAGFSEVWDLLTDIELVLLHKSDKDNRLIELAKQMPLSNGYQVAERLLGRLESAPREKKLWKNVKDVATLVTQLTIARCMVVPVCAGPVRTILYYCGRALARASPPARLPRAAASLAAPAASARHLHTLASALHTQSAESEELKPFVVELYVRAITSGMNELEKLKLKPEYEEKEARATEQTLATWFIQLGALLARSPRMQCECILTAFSVHPSHAMFDRIKSAPPLPARASDVPKQEPTASTSEFGSWASDSRTQTNFVKTSEHLNMQQTQHQANVLSTAILNEGEALGLDQELCQDITVLLSGPRVKTLSWDVDRKVLLSNCCSYMERCVNGTRALTTELKYLNLDPRHYQHLPEDLSDEDDVYYGIEKGYEQHLPVEPEPEQIWESAYCDAERTISAASSYDDGQEQQKKKHYSSESDCDPLSMVADKKEKKKERPHSKERSKERKKKPKDTDKNKQPKDKDKEQKEAKNKDKEPAEGKKDVDKKKEKKEKKERKKREKKEKAINPFVGIKVSKVSLEDAANHNICITDSNLDSPGPSSALSEGLEEKVVYDGQFAMDEIKSPEKSKEDASTNFNTCLEAARRNAVAAIKKAQDKLNKTSSVVRPGSAAARRNSPAPHHTSLNYEVKKNIKKLLQFRRQKMFGSSTSPMTSSTQPGSGPAVASAPQSDLAGTLPPTVNLTKEQQNILNIITSEAKTYKSVFCSSKSLKNSSSCSRTQPFHPATSSKKQPRPTTQIDTSQFDEALNLSQQKPVPLKNKLSQPDPQTQGVMPQSQTIPRVSDSTHLSSYEKFLRELKRDANAGFDMPSVPNPESKKQTKPLSKVTPVVPHTTNLVTSTTTTSSTDKTENETDLNIQHVIKKTQPKNNTQKIDNTQTTVNLNVNAIKTESGFTPTVHNIVKTETTVTPTILNLINADSKATPTMHAMIQQEPMISPQCAKPIVQSKKVENAPNTFARLSYMHKNKLNDKSKQIMDTSSALQSKAISEELDRRIAELNATKLRATNSQKEYSPLRGNATSQMVKAQESPRVEVQNIEDLMTSHKLNQHHPLLASILKNNNITIKTSNVPTEEPRIPKQQNTALTEKDQQDLRNLLGQQHLLNRHTPKSNTQHSNLINTQFVNNLTNIDMGKCPIETNTNMHRSSTPVNTSKQQATQESKIELQQFEKTPFGWAKISDTTIKKTTAMVQNKAQMPPKTKQKKVRQPKAKIDSINLPVEVNSAVTKMYVPKPPVPTLQYREDLPEQNWTEVLDAIRAHKTPSRGPKALDVLLKKDSFEQVIERNQRIATATTVNMVDSTIKPPNLGTQLCNVLTSTEPPRSSANRICILKVPNKEVDAKLQNIISTKKSASLNNKVNVNSEMTKKEDTKELQKGVDPFISGIPNSDYEILEELMDDDLRQEIGELLSDEDVYKVPVESSSKNLKNTGNNTQTVIRRVKKPLLLTSSINTPTSNNQLQKPKPQIISNEKVDFGTLSKSLIGSKIIRQPTTIDSKDSKIYNVNNTVEATNTASTTTSTMFYNAVPPTPPIQNMVIIDPYGMSRNIGQTFIPMTNTTNLVYQHYTAPLASQIIIRPAVSVVYNNPQIISSDVPIMHIPETAKIPVVSMQTNIPVPNLQPLELPNVKQTDKLVNNNSLEKNEVKSLKSVRKGIVTPAEIAKSIPLDKTCPKATNKAPINIQQSTTDPKLTAKVEGPSKTNEREVLSAVPTTKTKLTANLEVPSKTGERKVLSAVPTTEPKLKADEEVLAKIVKRKVQSAVPTTEPKLTVEEVLSKIGERIVLSAVPTIEPKSTANVEVPTKTDETKVLTAVSTTEPKQTVDEEVISKIGNRKLLSAIPTTESKLTVEEEVISKIGERKVLSEVQEKLMKENMDSKGTEQIDPVNNKSQERLAKKRLAIINRNINNQSFHPAIPLTYSPLKVEEKPTVSSSMAISLGVERNTVSTNHDATSQVTESSICKSKENNGSCRRILLRSSNKVETKVISVENTQRLGSRKTKVRLKAVESTKSQEIEEPYIEIKSENEKQVHTMSTSNISEDENISNKLVDNEVPCGIRTSKRILHKKVKKAKEEKVKSKTVKMTEDSKNKQPTSVMNNKVVQNSIGNDSKHNKGNKRSVSPATQDVFDIEDAISGALIPKPNEAKVYSESKTVTNTKNVDKSSRDKKLQKNLDDIVKKCHENALKNSEIDYDETELKLASGSSGYADLVNHKMTKLVDDIESAISAITETTVRSPLLVTHEEKEAISTVIDKETVTQHIPTDHAILTENKLTTESSKNTVGALPQTSPKESQKNLSDKIDNKNKTLNSSLCIRKSTRNASKTIATVKTLKKQNSISENKLKIRKHKGNGENNTQSKNVGENISSPGVKVSDKTVLEKLLLQSTDNSNTHQTQTTNTTDENNKVITPDVCNNNESNGSIDSIDPQRPTRNESVFQPKEPASVNQKIDKETLAHVTVDKKSANKDEVSENNDMVLSFDKQKRSQLQEIILPDVPLDQMSFLNSSLDNNDDDVILLSSESGPDLNTTSNNNVPCVQRPTPVRSETIPAINDIPQSFKDSIQIKEIPMPGNTIPNKRCVRITLPNKKVFKATVHGKVNVSFDTLFEEPALKQVLLGSMNERKRYTLNIQQLSTTDHRVIETVVREINDTKNHSVKTVDYVNLISDDEDELDEKIPTALSSRAPVEKITTASGSRELVKNITTAPGSRKPVENISTALGSRETGEKITIPSGSCEPVEKITTTSGSRKSDEKISTAPDSREPGKKITTASGSRKPVEKISTALGSRETSEKISNASGSSEPMEKITTASGSRESDEKISLTPGSRKPGKKMTTASGSHAPVEKITTASDSRTSVGNITTATGSRKPSKKITTASVSRAPVEEITTESGSRKPGENITTECSSLTGENITIASGFCEPVKNITIASGSRKPGEKITTASDSRTSVENITTAFGSRETGEKIATASGSRDAGKIISIASDSCERGEKITTAFGSFKVKSINQDTLKKHQQRLLQKCEIKLRRCDERPKKDALVEALLKDLTFNTEFKPEVNTESTTEVIEIDDSSSDGESSQDQLGIDVLKNLLLKELGVADNVQNDSSNNDVSNEVLLRNERPPRNRKSKYHRVCGPRTLSVESDEQSSPPANLSESNKTSREPSTLKEITVQNNRQKIITPDCFVKLVNCDELVNNMRKANQIYEDPVTDDDEVMECAVSVDSPVVSRSGSFSILNEIDLLDQPLTPVDGTTSPVMQVFETIHALRKSRKYDRSSPVMEVYDIIVSLQDSPEIKETSTLFYNTENTILCQSEWFETKRALYLRNMVDEIRNIDDIFHEIVQNKLENYTDCEIDAATDLSTTDNENVDIHFKTVTSLKLIMLKYFEDNPIVYRIKSGVESIDRPKTPFKRKSRDPIESASKKVIKMLIDPSSTKDDESKVDINVAFVSERDEGLIDTSVQKECELKLQDDSTLQQDKIQISNDNLIPTETNKSVEIVIKENISNRGVIATLTMTTQSSELCPLYDTPDHAIDTCEDEVLLQSQNIAAACDPRCYPTVSADDSFESDTPLCISSNLETIKNKLESTDVSDGFKDSVPHDISDRSPVPCKDDLSIPNEDCHGSIKETSQNAVENTASEFFDTQTLNNDLISNNDLIKEAEPALESESVHDNKGKIDDFSKTVAQDSTRNVESEELPSTIETNLPDTSDMITEDVSFESGENNANCVIKEHFLLNKPDTTSMKVTYDNVESGTPLCPSIDEETITNKLNLTYVADGFSDSVPHDILSRSPVPFKDDLSILNKECNNSAKETSQDAIENTASEFFGPQTLNNHLISISSTFSEIREDEPALKSENVHNNNGKIKYISKTDAQDSTRNVESEKLPSIIEKKLPDTTDMITGDILFESEENNANCVIKEHFLLNKPDTTSLNVTYDNLESDTPLCPYIDEETITNKLNLTYVADGFSDSVPHDISSRSPVPFKDDLSIPNKECNNSTKETSQDAIENTASEFFGPQTLNNHLISISSTFSEIREDEPALKSENVHNYNGKIKDISETDAQDSTRNVESEKLPSIIEKKLPDPSDMITENVSFELEENCCVIDEKFQLKKPVTTSMKITVESNTPLCPSTDVESIVNKTESTDVGSILYDVLDLPPVTLQADLSMPDIEFKSSIAETSQNAVGNTRNAFLEPLIVKSDLIHKSSTLSEIKEAEPAVESESAHKNTAKKEDMLKTEAQNGTQNVQSEKLPATIETNLPGTSDIKMEDVSLALRENHANCDIEENFETVANKSELTVVSDRGFKDSSNLPPVPLKDDLSIPDKNCKSSTAETSQDAVENTPNAFIEPQIVNNDLTRILNTLSEIKEPEPASENESVHNSNCKTEGISKTEAQDKTKNVESEKLRSTDITNQPDTSNMITEDVSFELEENNVNCVIDEQFDLNKSVTTSSYIADACVAAKLTEVAISNTEELSSSIGETYVKDLKESLTLDSYEGKGKFKNYNSSLFSSIDTLSSVNSKDLLVTDTIANDNGVCHMPQELSESSKIVDIKTDEKSCESRDIGNTSTLITTKEVVKNISESLGSVVTNVLKESLSMNCDEFSSDYSVTISNITPRPSILFKHKSEDSDVSDSPESISNITCKLLQVPNQVSVELIVDEGKSGKEVAAENSAAEVNNCNEILENIKGEEYCQSKITVNENIKPINYKPEAAIHKSTYTQSSTEKMEEISQTDRHSHSDKLILDETQPIVIIETDDIVVPNNNSSSELKEGRISVSNIFDVDSTSAHEDLHDHYCDDKSKFEGLDARSKRDTSDPEVNENEISSDNNSSNIDLTDIKHNIIPICNKNEEHYSKDHEMIAKVDVESDVIIQSIDMDANYVYETEILVETQSETDDLDNVIKLLPEQDGSDEITSDFKENNFSDKRIMDNCLDEEIIVEKTIKEVDCDDDVFEKNATLVYKDDSGVILKGIQYEDPEIGTCYVFPLVKSSDESGSSEVLSSSLGSTIEVIQEIEIEEDVVTHSIDLYDETDLTVIEPKLTYSKRNLKRKSNMRDVTCSEKRSRRNSRNRETTEIKIIGKKYRKSKNIDMPRLSATSIEESANIKDFKRRLHYYSTVGFSYSVTFSTEFIDASELLTNWPINGPIQCKIHSENETQHALFDDLDREEILVRDPLQMTLVEEIEAENEKEYPNWQSQETNFNMGFGERSGRVIQNLDGGTILKFSAATLSDVKHNQPCLQSEKYSVSRKEQNFLKTSKKEQLQTIRRYLNYLQIREKVRSFFRNSSFELISELNKEVKGKDKIYDPASFPFESFYSKCIEPFPTETIVQVVQVGQLPVSASAQNPVTCDPRVTQVSDASPSQCSVVNSPHDDSQPEIKTEYTELTTADLSLPLVDDCVHDNQTLPRDSQNSTNISNTENIPIQTELVKSEVKIELVEETPEEKDNSELPETNNHVSNAEYLYDGNNINNPSVETEFQALFVSNKQDITENAVQPKSINGSSEKTDQIAHAMNAAGIATSETPNTRAQALVNILTQKLRPGSIITTPNSMSLQQALASILPPPLNQTSSPDINQQGQNTVTPQVLHIVQGKNSSGNQITLVDNSQQSVITTPNATPVLHIVQNKSTASGQNANGSPSSQPNTFSGLSLVDAGLQQGGNQLLHIVNTGNQKNNNAGQLLKRVNLLTNLANVQGSNEQKMVQFVCKSADGKSIQLNAPHQRSMVLRLQPIETPNVPPATPKPADTNQDLSPSQSSNSATSKDVGPTQQEIKSRSVYEENYAKFIQNSSNKPTLLEKSNSLPKFNQVFGKAVFQDGNQKPNEINSNNLPSVNNSADTPECSATDNAINLDHIGQISSPPLLLRKSPAQTTQSQPNLVQQIKQTIAPMNIQTMHGGVIYTRQIPVNIGGGQTINLITVPSTELIDESGQKQQVNQGETIEPSIIKIVPQSQPHSNAEVSDDMNNDNAQQSTPQPQPVLTQMRIKLPMLSKTPQMVSGARVVRPSFFQIQRNVISGGNQAVYQQLVLTAAPPLGQQTIRLPQGQARHVKIPENQSSSETQMSSSTLEQLREFDMVLEQVKERSTVQPNSNPGSNFKLHTSSSDTTDSPVTATSTSAETTQVLYSIGSSQPLNVTYVNRKPSATPTTSTFVRSPDSSGIVDSPTSSTHSNVPHTSTSEASSGETTHHKPVKVSSKSKSRPKSSSHPPNSMKLSSVPPKTSTQKPLEDEQTTQRILYILAEYKEQVENSPDKDKPAPRRRSNPPSNPGSSKRKKSSSGSRRSGRDMSPIGDDTCRTMGSEDSSCGTSQGDCTESCMDSHSPQDSPRKVARKLAFDQDPPTTTQPRSQPQRNVIVADGQTITVARGPAGKPATAVLMPANYILPVSMVKGGQQIAIVTNRGPKLLTVGGGEGGATNALLLQRLIGPAGLKPVLTRPGVRHVRLPTAALHNLQAFNLATATSIQPPDSTASPAPDPPSDLMDSNRADHSPWTDRESEVKPDRASSPDDSEPWNMPSSADPHDYSYEETVRADNMDRTVLDPIQDRYSPDMEAQRIFDKMFDVDAKKSYIVDSHVDSPRCAYDIDASDCDDKPYQVVHKKDGSHRQTRLSHVSAAALRHKYAILEHELRLQKSLSEECEDLGVDSPSASELFPEAELLFAASPAQDHGPDTPHRSHTPQPTLLNQSVIQPDIDDQIATDQLLPRHNVQEDRQELDVNLGLEDVGIVTVSEDGMQATIAVDQEEFARAHPNTTFHSEPTDDGEVQPFTISGLKSRQITSTIFHSNRVPATVLMTAPQATVISQAAPETSRNPVKYTDIDNMIHSIPSTHTNNINLNSVLVKDDGLTRFDNILTDSRELHLSNTASAIVHSAGNATQVIRRVCYDDNKRERENFLMDEPDALIAGDDAKMVAEDSSRDATLESVGGDDGNSSPERHAELFWESNSASERSESRRPDFSSDSEKCCKSPSYDETNSTDSSGVGAQMRLDSVIKEARGVERSGSAEGSSADDTHPPLRTYPPKRLYHNPEGESERSLSGKTRAGERTPDMEVRRRASGRGVVKRGCHCCNGSPAPPRTKKPRQRKPTMDFTN